MKYDSQETDLSVRICEGRKEYGETAYGKRVSATV